jgi:hypothetical protein
MKGARIGLYEKKLYNNENQKWEFKNNLIISKLNDKVFDVRNGNMKKGSKIHMWDKHSKENQLFEICYLDDEKKKEKNEKNENKENKDENIENEIIDNKNDEEELKKKYEEKLKLKEEEKKILENEIVKLKNSSFIKTDFEEKYLCIICEGNY